MLTAFVISLIISGLQAQVIDTARFQINYVPQLQNFSKLNQQAKIIDTATEKVSFTYDITPQRVDIDFMPTLITAAKIKPERVKPLYRNFIKVGFGYPVTPFAELAIHNGTHKKYSYGVNVHHFSSWAPPIGKKMKQYANYPMSDTRVEAFFSRLFKKQTLYASVGYNHEAARYYGFTEENIKAWGAPFNFGYYNSKSYVDSLKNNFHHVKAEVGIRSNYNLEERKLKQDVRLNYDGVFTNHQEMENHVGLTSFFAYDARWLKITGSQLYRLNFNFDYYNNRWNDLLRRSDNTFVINPELFANWTFGEYHIKVGVGTSIAPQLKDTINFIDTTLGTKKNTLFVIYPMAELQLGIVPGILSIYAGIDGQMKYNSYQSLLYENPFVKPNMTDLRCTKNWINIYGGIKGNLVKKLNYNLFARYSYAENMGFFITDTNTVLRNQFDMVWDDGGYLNVGLTMNWEVIRNLQIDFAANYWLYHLDTLAHAWYKPSLEISAAGSYLFRNMLIFSANFNLAFGTWAWEYDLANNNYHSKMMKPILDFGVGVEWLINDHFSAFLNINNLACQYYAKYYEYKNLGINAMVGVSYAFGKESFKVKKKK